MLAQSNPRRARDQALSARLSKDGDFSLIAPYFVDMIPLFIIHNSEAFVIYPHNSRCESPSPDDGNVVQLQLWLQALFPTMELDSNCLKATTFPPSCHARKGGV